MLEVARPSAIGFDPQRVEQVYDRLALWVHEDRIPGAGIAIARHGKMLEPRVFGRQRPDLSSPAMRQDAIFLIASPTKPITVMGAMLLVERGELGLDDRVVEHVPEFAPHGKEEVRIRHLMTHTSGLPDTIPENSQFRSQHKPLQAFVERVCQLELEFQPGTAVQYQSMGIAMLGEVVRRVSGLPVNEFLRKNIFQPLGLQDTELGSPESWWQGETPKAERMAQVRISEDAAKTDWNWNTRYWLGFGAPWGGLLTTPREFGIICQACLDVLKGEGPTLRSLPGDFGFGQEPAKRIQARSFISPAAMRAMTSNQLHYMSDIPEPERRTRPWGLGWRLNWPGHSANFGDLLGPRSFGHWGATGTLVWVDPDAEAFMVLFTTQPQEPDGRYLARISNMVSAALL